MGEGIASREAEERSVNGQPFCSACSSPCERCRRRADATRVDSDLRSAVRQCLNIATECPFCWAKRNPRDQWKLEHLPGCGLVKLVGDGT